MPRVKALCKPMGRSWRQHMQGQQGRRGVRKSSVHLAPARLVVALSATLEAHSAEGLPEILVHHLVRGIRPHSSLWVDRVGVETYAFCVRRQPCDRGRFTQSLHMRRQTMHYEKLCGFHAPVGPTCPYLPWPYLSRLIDVALSDVPVQSSLPLHSAGINRALIWLPLTHPNSCPCSNGSDRYPSVSLKGSLSTFEFVKLFVWLSSGQRVSRQVWQAFAARTTFPRDSICLLPQCSLN